MASTLAQSPPEAAARPPLRTPRADARARDEHGFRLRGRTHKAVLTAHVLSSVGWFGIATMVAFAAAVGAVTDDESLAQALHRTIELAPTLSVPVGAVSVVTGGLLGLGTRWGLVRHWWVVAKIAISAAVIATDVLFVGAIARDAAAGRASSAFDGPIVAHVVVLAIATALSVFKPRARTPFRRDR